MQNLSNKLNYTLLLALLMSLLLFTGNVSAKACKGMTKSACSTSTSCSWVKSYKTKKGVKVDAYCRNKAKKSTSNKVTKAKKESKKSTKAKKAAKTKKESKKTKKAAKSSKNVKKTAKKKSKKTTKKDKKSKTKNKKRKKIKSDS